MKHTPPDEKEAKEAAMKAAEAIKAKAIKNMSFTLRAMAELSTSRAVFFETSRAANFIFATGTDSASENWAFFPSLPAGEAEIKRVCSFFGKLPFVFPLFPYPFLPEPSACGQILEKNGLLPRGELQVMARGLSDAPPEPESGAFTFEINADADEWAETAWQAFDSPPGAPGTFVDLARGLGANKNFFLILAKKNDRPAGTAMLSSNSGQNAGIYYFATLPEERKKGAGGAMLEETARLAFRLGHNSLTLQATPSGAPFYASRGFRALFSLPLYSSSQDVF